MARILIGNIKGPKGDTGAQGPQGATGPQGPQGPLPPLVNNALATEAGVSALDAAMGKTLQEQITNNKNDITELNSKFPDDRSYFTAVIPRVKDITSGADQPNLRADVEFMIQTKGIKSGEYGFSSTQYTDLPASAPGWGYVKYFQHADNYVTVLVFPDGLSGGVLIRQFVLGREQWETEWKKIDLLDVS